ncbi:hypothetical protein [Aeromonas salmonicida]|uniref:hypothetical protein n=1 Tax=Aeromonas salmonicida TaxID=645 RepID=UPI000B402F4B|nr:hypothetical protein [Aeromonas salmonicida]ARW85312.1 hypothetical protein O23A_P3p0013 [Aeromonas salmonicida]
MNKIISKAYLIITMILIVMAWITFALYPEVTSGSPVTYEKLAAVTECLNFIMLEFGVAVVAHLFLIVYLSNRNRSFQKNEILDLIAFIPIILAPIVFMFMSVDFLHGLTAWLMRDTDVVAHTIRLANISKSIDGEAELINETYKSISNLLRDENRFKYHDWAWLSLGTSSLISILGLSYVHAYCSRRNNGATA